MFLMFFTIFALIVLCPVATNAANKDKTSKFGTVIGIGQYLPASPSFMPTAVDDDSQILVQPIPASGESFQAHPVR